MSHIRKFTQQIVDSFLPRQRDTWMKLMQQKYILMDLSANAPLL